MSFTGLVEFPLLSLFSFVAPRFRKQSRCALIRCIDSTLEVIALIHFLNAARVPSPSELFGHYTLALDVLPSDDGLVVHPASSHTVGIFVDEVVPGPFGRRELDGLTAG